MRAGDTYPVIDLSNEMETILDDGCQAEDDLDAAAGWPHLPEELRAQLAATYGK